MQKTVKIPQLLLVQFLVVIDTPVVFVTTGACAGPDSAENVWIPHAFLDMVLCPSLCNDRCRLVETVQNTVEFPQLVLLLDKVVDVPVLATSRVSRGSAVAVHRLVVAAHHGYDELMRRLFRTVHRYTARVDPRHQGGEGVARSPGV